VKKLLPPFLDELLDRRVAQFAVQVQVFALSVSSIFAIVCFPLIFI
jgi:hypothetical protein